MENLIQRVKQQPRHGQRLTGNTSRPVTQGASGGVTIANTTNEQVLALAQELANEIVAQQTQAQLLARSGRVFTKFDAVNDIVSNQIETVTGGVWSDGAAGLTTYFTSSNQTVTQRRYYVDTYQAVPTADGAETQFSLAYGHALGSGSSAQGSLSDSPSKAVYSQYKQLLLNPTDTRFTTAGSGSTDSIYVVNFKRDRLKERLDAGNFELPLANIVSRGANATGSITVGSNVITLIDDSAVANPTIGDSGKVYNIVSGSIAGGIHNPQAPVYYGLSYPDHGVLVLDGKMLDQHLNFTTNTQSSTGVEGNNHFGLFHSISGSGVAGREFLARNSEKITSTHYFARIKNAEYNFSNNPSYVTGSVGELSQTSFVGDPKTYVTTVGLYNDNQELLAVAKLSKPLLKSFQRESLIRIKLDF